MKLADLISRVDANVLTVRPPRDVEITRVFAGDRISDLISQGAAETLLVTNLSGFQVFRVAELMGTPALCLLNGEVPDPGLVAAAEIHGTVVLVSPLSMFETCGRLYECFDAVRMTRP